MTNTHTIDDRLNLNEILGSDRLTLVDNCMIGEKGAMIVLGDGEKNNLIIIDQDTFDAHPELMEEKGIDHVIIGDSNDENKPILFYRSTCKAIKINHEYPKSEFDDLIDLILEDKKHEPDDLIDSINGE